MRSYMSNYIIIAICWSLGGSISLSKREEFSKQVLEIIKKKGILINK